MQHTKQIFLLIMIVMVGVVYFSFTDNILEAAETPTICGIPDPRIVERDAKTNMFCDPTKTNAQVSNPTPKVGELFRVTFSLHIGGPSQTLKFKSEAQTFASPAFSFNGHPFSAWPPVPINLGNGCIVASGSDGIRNGMTWFDVAGGVNAHGDGSISVGVVCTTIGNKSFAGQIEDAPVVGPVAVAVEVVPADTTPPTITITNTPPDIQTWRDTAVNVKIGATDDKALSKVEYWWDTELHTVETATGVSWTKTIQSPLLKSSGGHTLSVIATDAAGNSSPASATPYRLNQCPVPVDINWAVNQDSIDNIFYIQEKVVSDGDGDAMTFTITDSPDHAQPGTGGLNINQFSYTPVLGYIGSDSFTFKASDAICPTDQIPAKATGTVNITVRDVNTPPTCGTKLVSTPQNTAVSIALPGADSDTPVHTWTATPDSGFYHGTLVYVL